MKNVFKAAVLAVACLFILSAFIGCKEKDGGNDTEVESYSGMPEYDGENIESYVKPFEYTGLTVYVGFGETKQQRLWDTIVSSAEVIEYPQAQLEYYAEQERAKYRYYAKRDGIEYSTLLSELGVTEESIKETARAYVKDDLVLEYIIKDASISLTDDEKTALTDKYAEKLATVYGNDAEYIKTNMTEQIYDAMLSDKTMEYLLLNNTVYTNQSK